MPEKRPDTMVANEHDIVGQASEIVESAKGEQISEFFQDGRYLPRQILDSRTGLFIDIQGTTRSEIIEELRALREADID